MPLEQSKEQDTLADKLVTICTDPELGAILGAYITNFTAQELLVSGRIAIEDRERLVGIGIANLDQWVPEDTTTNKIYAQIDKIGWETTKKVARLNKILPPEEPPLRLQTISFSERYRREGLAACFTAGSSYGGGGRGKITVPDRTVRILQALNIPFKLQDKK